MGNLFSASSSSSSQSPIQQEEEKKQEVIKLKEVAKVLVLCQRKSDPNDADLAATNASLEKYIYSFFDGTIDSAGGEILKIEYLSEISESTLLLTKRERAAAAAIGTNRWAKATVDYRIKFEDNAPTRAFVSDHLKTYSLIVLQTCPFIILAENEKTAQYLSEIMTDDGFLIITAFSKDNINTPLSANIASIVLKQFPGRGFESKTWKKYFKIFVREDDQIIFEKKVKKMP